MRKFKILGFSYSLNASAHRERPERGSSMSSQIHRGRDAVARLVSRSLLYLPLVLSLCRGARRN